MLRLKKVAPKKTQQKKELHPGGGRDKLELLLCARIWFPSKETKYGCCFLCLPTVPKSLRKSKREVLLSFGEGEAEANCLACVASSDEEEWHWKSWGRKKGY